MAKEVVRDSNLLGYENKVKAALQERIRQYTWRKSSARS